MGRFISTAALFVASCTSVQVDQIDVPTSGADYFFWVAHDRDGIPLRLSPVFGVDGSKIVFGGDPLFKLEGEETGAIAVGFTRDDLFALHAGFLSDRASSINAALETPPEVTIAYDEYARGPLPGGAQMIAADGADPIPAILSAITLSFPIDPEWCRSENGTRLNPFGATGQLLPPELVIPEEDRSIGPDDHLRRFERAYKIGPDRVLVASQRLLSVVVRGQPYRVASAFRTYDIPPTPIHVRAIALAPKRADGTIPILGAGIIGSQPGIFELELDRDLETIRYVRTATALRDADDFQLLDVMIDQRGNAIAAGEHNLVLVRPSGEADFVLSPPPGSNPEVVYRRVIETHDPDAPHLLADDEGRVVSGDAVARRWETFQRIDRLDNRRLYAAAAAPDGSELWVGGPRGAVLAKKRGEAWDLINIVVPPSFGPCASPTPDGGRAFVSTIRAIALDDQAGYIGFSECNAVLRVRRSDHCVSILRPEGVAVMPANLHWETVWIGDGELIAGGTNGMLYAFPSP